MKFALYIGASLGGLIGSYLPVLLWHADAFGFASVASGVVGTIGGIIGGYYAGKYFEL